MSDEPVVYLYEINMDGILSMKTTLKQQEILEPVLSSNMDFAVREIMFMEPALLSGASLFVSGESALVKFLPSPYQTSSSAKQDQNRIHFTVICKDGQPQLIRRVTCSGVITASDIKDAHFSGHNCQDRVKSCLQQAREIVSQHKTLEVLNIICHGLSLTYTFNYLAAMGQNGADQSPESTQQSAVTSYTVKTRCRFVFKGYIDIQRLLDVRCWLEQEKPLKRGLTDCIDHLLKKIIESTSRYITGGVILQSDGEVVELGLEGRYYDYFIYDCPTGVCMIPENLRK